MARRLKSRGQKDRQVSSEGCHRVTDDEGGSRPLLAMGPRGNQASGGPSDHHSDDVGVVNIAWRRDNLVIVERGPEGVVIRERAAEYSCFVKNDLDANTKRAIRDHKAVYGIKEEGEWLRILWRSTQEREKYCKLLEADGLQTYEGDVNPVRRYMTDNEPKLATPRACGLDIETDSRVPPRIAAEGKARILCWTVIGADGTRKVGVLEADTDQAERRLLQRLFLVLEDYDQIAAWYGDHFDFPIIKARAIARRVKVNFDRWLWLDQMDLFVRMNMMAAESGEEKASYSLQAIATELLGVGKDDFDSSQTWEYWKAGGEKRQKLVRYCVNDTDLLRRIEETNGYIALLQTLAEACNVFADSKGMNPTIQAEGFLLKLAKQRGYKFPSNFKRGGHDPFKGAYVMEPQGTGIIKNVHVGDFKSLYPSIIVTWNMSPETLAVGKEHDDLELAQVQGGAPWEDSYSNVPSLGWFFSTEQEGILPLAVKELMRLRKAWDDEKAKHPPGSPAWVRANRKSTAYKIAANSFYGVVGSPMSRFFNRDVAESVTQVAAWLIVETISAAEFRSMNAIYGDTDSLFIAGCTRTEFEVFVEWCNRDLYPELLKQYGCKENFIRLAYEKEFERIIFSRAASKDRATMKRYVGRYVHFKGTPADETSKPEVKGLEYKRGDSIRLARGLQAEVIDWLMGGGIVREKRTEECVEDPTFFEEVLSRWQTRILYEPLELTDVVIRKRLNKKLDEYVRKRKKDGSWAKQLPHIELARKLYDKGEDVGEGTKISYFVVDASKKGDVQYCTEAEWEGECDRYEVWDRLTWPATERLLSAAFPGYSWAQYDRTRPKPVKQPRIRGKASAVTA